MNPRSCDERKNPFCVSSKKCFKYNVKPAHWVGHSQLISLDTDDLFKRTPFVDEKKANVTGNTMKQSVSGKKNPVLLQEQGEMCLKRLMIILV